MNNPVIAALSTRAALLAYKIHLPISWAVKQTIFKHFCGGETLEECEKTIQELGSNGIGSTLEYSVENDEGDKFFENTTEEIIKAIHFATKNPYANSIAIKPTGLMSHKLLAQGNAKTRHVETRHASSYERAVQRIDRICNAAHQSNIEVYIDAEESPEQAAIDELSICMMKKYNKEKPLVYITLQMYRRDRLEYLDYLLGLSKKENFLLGVKLVRGAYWQAEVERGRKKGILPLVFLEKHETDSAFNKAIEVCVNNIGLLAVCAATHNEESARCLVEASGKMKPGNGHERIKFSQLYGMSDHISFSLAAAGYQVSKYLPYGPIKQVIPYLIRRAEENTSIQGQVGRELKMIEAARKRQA